MNVNAISTLLLFTIGATALGQQERKRRPGGGRGPDNAPALGAAIPEVSAKTADGKQTIELSKPERHTVLIFGSHT